MVLPFPNKVEDTKKLIRFSLELKSQNFLSFFIKFADEVNPLIFLVRVKINYEPWMRADSLILPVRVRINKEPWMRDDSLIFLLA